MPSTVEPTAETLEEQVAALDLLLRESISHLGLDIGAARRELVESSCIGVGGEGRTVSFSFDEPSHRAGVEHLRALEEYWSSGKFELNGPEPFQNDGELVSLLAFSGPFDLGGWWYPRAKELEVSGTTPCA